MPLRAGLQSVLRHFQEMALIAAYLLAFVGWFFFFFSLWILVSTTTPRPMIADVFQCCGVLLAGAWLLFRFASALFPFGRRFFR